MRRGTLLHFASGARPYARNFSKLGRKAAVRIKSRQTRLANTKRINTLEVPDYGADTTLLSWGNGAFGGLGNGETWIQRQPMVVPALEGIPLQHVSAGWKQSLVLTRDGRVCCWGWMRYNRSFMFALRMQRWFPNIFSWLQSMKLGTSGFAKQLDIGRLSFTPRSTPEFVPGFSKEQGKRAVLGSCGGEQAALITDDGYLYTWLGNFWGQCGHPDSWATRWLKEPTRVEKLKDYRMVNVSCAFQHTVALDEEGGVWVWGRSLSGALGIPSLQEAKLSRVFEPVPLQYTLNKEGTNKEGLGPCTHIATGFSHTMLLDLKGQVWTFGRNSNGQLGLGNFDPIVPYPRKVRELARTKIVKIASGEFHCVALAGDGTVFTWGTNRCGQLARPDEHIELNETVMNKKVAKKSKMMPKPMPIQLAPHILAGSTVVDIFAGPHDTALLLDDGRTIQFGGHNDSEYSSLPEESLSEHRLHHLVFGMKHTLAIATPRQLSDSRD